MFRAAVSGYFHIDSRQHLLLQVHGSADETTIELHRLIVVLCLSIVVAVCTKVLAFDTKSNHRIRPAAVKDKTIRRNRVFRACVGTRPAIKFNPTKTVFLLSCSFSCNHLLKTNPNKTYANHSNTASTTATND